MTMMLNRKGYQELIDGDLEWLLRQKRCLERDHIEAVLRESTERIYGQTDLRAPFVRRPTRREELDEAIGVRRNR